MNDKLSIIIPCYNCERTLEEAVNSCYIEPPTIPFELVLVDDASKDKTREIMTRLSEKYKEVRCFYNETNKGGGATRNIAVKNATGNVIFCLDSDDMLTKGFLMSMYDCLKQNNMDGVCISTSIKFNGADIRDVNRRDNMGYVQEIIPPRALFEFETKILCPLYSTFMITKSAFLDIGGYPEEHGFDTQGMAFRFIVNGKKAMACPNTVYMHRIHFTKSYYIREYESGRIQHNWFKVFEEFLYIFNLETQEKILSTNLNGFITPVFDFGKKVDQMLKSNYLDYIRPNSRDKYGEYLQRQKNIPLTEKYWLATKKNSDAKYDEAFALFEELIRGGFDNGYAHYYLQQLCERTGKKSDLVDQKKIDDTFAYKKQGSQANIIIRVFRKAIKIINKSLK